MYGVYNVNSDFARRDVAIYARVSTEHEEQISALGNQMDWYKPILAARPEWTLVAQYVDVGITGTSAEKRPQFLKMIRDAKAHKFDMIITREVSRFARNTVDTLQYTRMLKEYGVEVFFINDNIKTFDGDGELRLTIMATLAQDESRKTSIRVKAGMQTAMEKGVLFGTGNVLGYDRVGKDFVINEEQAKTVQMIFEMYLNGMGVTRISYELEKAGRLTATGLKRWHPATVSHTLKNSLYCGILTYHKEYVPDYLKQKKVKNMGEMDKLYVKGTHPTIISEEDFERVQIMMDKKAHEVPNGAVGKRKLGYARSATTVWPRIMRCSCGAKFNQRSWNHHGSRNEIAFQCYRVINSGSVREREKKGLSTKGICTTPIIPEWKLEMIAKKIFSEFLSVDSEIIEEALRMLKEHQEDKNTKLGTDILDAKTEELERFRKKRENLVNMRMEGEIDKDYFVQKKAELEARMDILAQEIRKMTLAAQEDAERVSPEKKLADLKSQLEKYTDFKEMEVIPETVIEAFTKQIIVSDQGLDWYLRFKKMDKSLEEKVKGKRKQAKEDYEKVYSFTLTLEDAKAYVYSFSKKRRVLNWKDITVNLWM